ncbi:MAG: hypothetical protein ACR2PY_06320, partial [Salinispira sp.]
MFSVEKPERPGEVHLNHILFVEGTNESVDVTALGALFDNDLRIEALGPSYSIKSVAQALHSLHPLYYFLIDRDHYHLHEEFIQKCWADFPNPETHNLLIWKKKEFENYFLDPNYLSESQYCQVSKQKLEQKILQVSQKRLFIDAANYVVIEIREKLKVNWIEKFSNPDDFSSKEKALNKLNAAKEFCQHNSDVSNWVSSSNREKLFNNYLECMTGCQNTLSFGTGKWIDMIQ